MVNLSKNASRNNSNISQPKFKVFSNDVIYIHDDTVKSEKRLKRIFSFDNPIIVKIILKLTNKLLILRKQFSVV